MRITVVLNGISRKKKHYFSHYHGQLSEQHQLTLLQTDYAGHAVGLAQQAMQGKPDLIVAAGGDGTLNQVLNGMMHAQSSSPGTALGIIPLGTGNDYARFSGIADDKSFFDVLQRKCIQPIDIGRITFTNSHPPVFFLNVCSMGMGPQVVHEIIHDNRGWGADATYMKAIATVFLRGKTESITLTADDVVIHQPIRVLAISKGRTFGHNICVDPDASADNGQLSVCVLGDMPWWQFVFSLLQAKSGKRISSHAARYLRLTRLEITSPQKPDLETEGELAGYPPCTIEVLPLAVPFLRHVRT